MKTWPRICTINTLVFVPLIWVEPNKWVTNERHGKSTPHEIHDAWRTLADGQDALTKHHVLQQSTIGVAVGKMLSHRWRCQMKDHEIISTTVLCLELRG